MVDDVTFRHAGAHWRDSARTPRFFLVDAYAAFPLLIWLMHIRLWTLVTAIAFMAFFWVLERFKFRVPMFFRWLRAYFAGPIRYARPWWRN